LCARTIPPPESRAHDARERLEVEADREPVGMWTDLQRTGELRRQQGAASCTVVVDRDRTREQQTHRRSRTARSWIEDRGRDVCERRVDDPAVPREQTQQRSPVELEAVAGGCRDDVGPVQCHGRRGGLLPRLCKRLQHVGRPAGGRDDRRDINALGHHERHGRTGGEHARGRRGRVDGNKPAAGHMVGAAAGTDRHRAGRPGTQLRLDLRAALPTHVNSEQVHTRLRGAAELEPARDGGRRGGEQHDSQEDEDDALHHHSEATDAASRKILSIVRMWSCETSRP